MVLYDNGALPTLRLLKVVVCVAVYINFLPGSIMKFSFKLVACLCFNEEVN